MLLGTNFSSSIPHYGLLPDTTQNMLDDFNNRDESNDVDAFMCITQPNYPSDEDDNETDNESKTNMATEQYKVDPTSTFEQLLIPVQNEGNLGIHQVAKRTLWSQSTDVDNAMDLSEDDDHLMDCTSLKTDHVNDHNKYESHSSPKTKDLKIDMSTPVTCATRENQSYDNSNENKVNQVSNKTDDLSLNKFNIDEDNDTQMCKSTLSKIDTIDTISQVRHCQVDDNSDTRDEDATFTIPSQYYNRETQFLNTNSVDEEIMTKVSENDTKSLQKDKEESEKQRVIPYFSGDTEPLQICPDCNLPNSENKKAPIKPKENIDTNYLDDDKKKSMEQFKSQHCGILELGTNSTMMPLSSQNLLTNHSISQIDNSSTGSEHELENSVKKTASKDKSDKSASPQTKLSKQSKSIKKKNKTVPAPDQSVAKPNFDDTIDSNKVDISGSCASDTLAKVKADFKKDTNSNNIAHCGIKIDCFTSNNPSINKEVARSQSLINCKDEKLSDQKQFPANSGVIESSSNTKSAYGEAVSNLTKKDSFLKDVENPIDVALKSETITIKNSETPTQAWSESQGLTLTPAMPLFSYPDINKNCLDCKLVKEKNKDTKDDPKIKLDAKNEMNINHKSKDDSICDTSNTTSSQSCASSFHGAKKIEINESKEWCKDNTNADELSCTKSKCKEKMNANELSYTNSKSSNSKSQDEHDHNETSGNGEKEKCKDIEFSNNVLSKKDCDSKDCFEQAEESMCHKSSLYSGADSNMCADVQRNKKHPAIYTHLTPETDSEEKSKILRADISDAEVNSKEMNGQEIDTGTNKNSETFNHKNYDELKSSASQDNIRTNKQALNKEILVNSCESTKISQEPQNKTSNINQIHFKKHISLPAPSSFDSESTKNQNQVNIHNFYNCNVSLDKITGFRSMPGDLLKPTILPDRNSPEGDQVQIDSIQMKYNSKNLQDMTQDTLSQGVHTGEHEILSDSLRDTQEEETLQVQPRLHLSRLKRGCSVQSSSPRAYSTTDDDHSDMDDVDEEQFSASQGEKNILKARNEARNDIIVQRKRLDQLKLQNKQLFDKKLHMLEKEIITFKRKLSLKDDIIKKKDERISMLVHENTMLLEQISLLKDYSKKSNERKSSLESPKKIQRNKSSKKLVTKVSQINTNSEETIAKHPIKKPKCNHKVLLSSDEETGNEHATVSDEGSVFDDSNNLCGEGMLTRRSVGLCLRVIKEFMKLQSSKSFLSVVWAPLWDILSDQGENINWKHGRSFKELGPTWCFLVPESKGVKRGTEDKDYFLCEKKATIRICSELRKLIPHRFSELEFEAIQSMLDPELQSSSRRSSVNVKKRGIEDKHTTPQKKSKISSKPIERKSRCQTKKQEYRAEVTPIKMKNVRNHDDLNNRESRFLYSQTTMDGAQNLLTLHEKPLKTEKREIDQFVSPSELKKEPQIESENDALKKVSQGIIQEVYPFPTNETADFESDNYRSQNLKTPQKVATKDGILAICKMRVNAQSKILKKNNRTINLKDKDSPSKIANNLCHQESFHLTQSPKRENYQSSSGDFRQISSVHRKLGASKCPLQGLSFFISGCDDMCKIEQQITSLGGRVIYNLDDKIFTIRNRMIGKLFFLSQPKCRRRMKYIYAAALGVPMLHLSWIDEIVCRDVNGVNTNPFDSHLYESKRLPVGLCLSNGIFPLQRARHARTWTPPGAENASNPIFYRMHVMITREDEEKEIEW